MAKILYIEDDKPVRKAITYFLEREGHLVIAREDAEAAFAMTDLWKPDLVITDHNLGKGKQTGLHLALRLKKKGVNVVMLSGNDDARIEATEAEIPFFFKPCIISKLLNECLR